MTRWPATTACWLVAAVAHAEAPYVVVYDGYGTPSAFRLSGRVLEEAPRQPEGNDDGALKNLVAAATFNQGQYKGRRLQALFDALPKTRFVLVGDSGEHDPAVYRELARNNPGRVLGIVIRRGAPFAEGPDVHAIDDFAADPNAVARWVARASPTQPAGDDLADTAGAVRQLIVGLERTLAQARERGLLTEDAAAGFAVTRRKELRQLFAVVIDYVNALGALRGDLLARFERSGNATAFLLGYLAELALYVNTAQFLRTTVGVGHYETLFNEGSDGVHADAWSALKASFSEQPWARPLVLMRWQYEQLLPRYREGGEAARYAWAFEYVDKNHGHMLELGLSEAPGIALKTIGSWLTEHIHGLVFPGQEAVSRWLGHTRVHREGQSLVDQKQVEQVLGRLLPGDILLERRNWYLSNVGLPGFWPHVALYLGTPQEAAEHLGEDFVAGLRERYPEAVARWHGSDGEGHPYRVLEALSQGVVFTSLQYSAAADYLAVLRPRLGERAVAQALARAMAQHGKPYDFDFDFRTDAALVCSELVYKAYEAKGEVPGLRFPVEEIVGRPVLSPNAIAALYDSQAGTPEQQLDFVIFLEGIEGEGRAVWESEAAFRRTPTRPKWDIAQR